MRQWTGRRRKEGPQTARASQIAPSPPPSTRQTTRLLMADDDMRSDAEQCFVSRLLQQVPDLADCVAAAKGLKEVLRRKSRKTLDQVLDDAAGTALGSFVASLRRDLGAVKAALKLPWTTSPAEGQINRLKMLKRTMYGRAGFRLLRARVLYPT